MSGSQNLNIVTRYASALYSLLEEQGKTKFAAAVKELDALAQALQSSTDLQMALSNPTFSKETLMDILDALMKKMKISGYVKNFVMVLASNRRLSMLSSILTEFNNIMNEKNDLLTADVISSQELSSAQTKELEKALFTKTGKTVSLNVTVDPSIIGGLIVKIGSQMIDASIKTRLNSLKLAMQEAA